MTLEKKRSRTITGWRQVDRKPGIARRRFPAPAPSAILVETRVAPPEPAANERWEDEGGTAKK